MELRDLPMRALFDEPPRRRRSPLAVVLSVLMHGGAVALVALLASRAGLGPRLEVPGRIMTVILSAPPRILESSQPIQLPTQITAKPAPTLTLNIPPPPSPVEEPAPPPAEPAKPIPPAGVKAAAPKRDDIRVGLFESGPAPTAPEPARQLNAAGFDAAAAIAPDLKLRAAATGAFDATTPNARPGTDRSRGVAGATGFDSGPVAARQSGGGVVRSTGFGAAGAQTLSAARAPAVVHATDFDDTPAVATAAQAPKAVRSTPVEILFKPVPDYTDEARALHLQGEVVLEVEFAASGTAHVIRVVRGLGHGLDEMATRAASQIRFKPAVNDGQPVDVRSTVRIIFRLT